MDEVLKPISFYDRNHNIKYRNIIVCEPKERKVLVFKDVLNEKTGTICKKSELKVVDRYEEMKNYRVSDFSIDNLQAIGAKLETTHLIGDVDLKISHIERQAQQISQTIENK